jgi:hypothetical protein
MQGNHINLFNKLTALLWEPGHMGAFLGRFLFDKILEKSNLNKDVKPNYNKKMQVEWHWDDITDEYFQFNELDWKLKLHDGWNILKQHYPEQLEFDAALCYILAQKNYQYYSTSTKLPVRSVTRLYLESEVTTETLDTAHLDFEFNNITFPYVKSHIRDNIKHINRFPWKKKVICRFPRNKAWMGDLFLFYKHYWFYFDLNNPRPDISTFNDHNKEALIRAVENKHHFLHNFDEYNPINDISDYIIIDMYELIFNEQCDQIKLIDDEFVNVSETQLQLLSDARTGLIEILDVFGLSHTLDIVTSEDHASKFLTKQILDAYNAVKSTGPISPVRLK